jgi:hypothetical protein
MSDDFSDVPEDISVRLERAIRLSGDPWSAELLTDALNEILRLKLQWVEREERK